MHSYQLFTTVVRSYAVACSSWRMVAVLNQRRDRASGHCGFPIRRRRCDGVYRPTGMQRPSSRRSRLPRGGLADDHRPGDRASPAA